MWLKRQVGTGMCCGGTCTWRWTLACWQPKQAFAQAVTSVETCCFEGIIESSNYVKKTINSRQ
jgi:hypothetical protein